MLLGKPAKHPVVVWLIVIALGSFACLCLFLGPIYQVLASHLVRLLASSGLDSPSGGCGEIATDRQGSL